MSPDAPWQVATDDHLLRFQPGGRVLQVTFDHLKPHRGRDGLPEPWGWRFAIQNGWSILGIASLKPVWFREAALHAALLRLRDGGFFQAFDRVVFAGSSKGGFGALVFASLAPGATVIAIDPQSTLDRGLVPWETRYPLGDWAPPFRDAAEELATASRIWLLHDPHFDLDRRHADRLSAPGLRLLPCRHLGHGLAESLQKIEILGPVMRGFTEGTLDEAGFWALYRTRRKLVRYPRALFAHALARRHFRLAERMARLLATQREDGHWFLARAALFEAAAGDDAAFLRGLAMMQKADR